MQANEEESSQGKQLAHEYCATQATLASDPLGQSFWYGKALRLSNEREDVLKRCYEEAAVKGQSCLSPDVHALVVDSLNGIKANEASLPLINERGVLNWHLFTQQSFESCASTDKLLARIKGVIEQRLKRKEEEKAKKEQIEKEMRELELRRNALAQEENKKYASVGGNTKNNKGSKDQKQSKNSSAQEKEKMLKGEQQKKSEEMEDSDIHAWMDVVQMAIHVQRASISVHAFLKSLDATQFVQTYQDRFAVFQPNPDQFVKVFRWHVEEKKSLAAFLYFIPIFERAIMNVYMAATKGEGNPRLILRDLLGTDELKSIFGDKLLVIRAVMGTPIGLNLRNIGWHGFFSEEEFWEGYLSFAMVLALSLSEEILPILSSMPLRQLVSLSAVYDSVSKTGDKEFYNSNYLNTNPVEKEPLKDIPVDTIRELFKRSFFPLRQNRSIYLDALEAFAYGDYYKCLSLMLPCVEHSLRRIFVSLNQGSSSYLNAVMYDYYTTLDVLLAEKVEWNGEDNKLRKELGNPIYHALLDFLVFPAGPRIRDTISHGEADPTGVSFLLCSRFLGLVVQLCLQYDPYPIDSPCDFFIECEGYYKKAYIPLYHEKTSLVHKIFQAKEEWEGMQSKYSAHLSASSSSQEKEDAAHRSTLKEIVNGVMETLRNKHNNNKNKNDDGWSGERLLFTGGRTMEKTEFMQDLEMFNYSPSNVGYMKKLAGMSVKLIHKIAERYDELHSLVETRKARTRQRKSYAKLCEELPFFYEMVRLIGLVCEDAIHRDGKEEKKKKNDEGSGKEKESKSESIEKGNEKEGKDEDKSETEGDKTFAFLFKGVICVERFLSFLKENKWEEAIKIFSSYFAEVQRYYMLPH